MNNKFLQYSSMAFELAAYIGIGVLAGNFLDKKIGFTNPYCTAGLALIGVCGGMYKFIRASLKD
ncbi:MAG: AtpZ/AtpI family protein [Chitinophagales bacterium]|jgi:F0F1-type ATP synthase assembly protein I|nr:AtpZ/AtpI family protein [Chitinophagales bacterium]